MIEVGVVDLSAEGRRKLATLVERWLWINPDSKNLTLPRISTHLLSPEELRFHGSLDVCLVGPELHACDVGYISVIRKQLPQKVLISVLDSRSYSFGMIEQLGRLEVDDVLMDTASGDEFFRRLILLQRRVSRKQKGKVVVVDAARGGVGATFVTAGLAECHLDEGRRVVVIDGDVVSQDLSRFLQAKPFVNESLKVLLDQGRVVTTETVQECVCQVWEDEEKFGVVSPPAASDQAVFSSPTATRAFVSVLDILANLYDVVIIDSSSLVASLRLSLYQIADEVVLVSNRDPAGAYANRHALSLVAGGLRRGSRLVAVLNDTGCGKAAISTLKEEVLVAGDCNVEVVLIPFSSRASRWACSGSTPGKVLRRHFSLIAGTTDGTSTFRREIGEGLISRSFSFLKARVKELRIRKASSSKALPNISAQALERDEDTANAQSLPLLLDSGSEKDLVSRATMME